MSGIKKTLRVLIIEDSEFDARVMVNVLRAGDYQPVFRRVDTDETLRTALKEQAWDVILADYNMPEFSAPAALKVTQELAIDTPFIIVSGGIGEDTAVSCMKAGAHDYLMKGNLARLVPAVERELREAENRRARRQAEQAVRESELRYRLLWETCPDAVILMDMDGFIQFVNPAVEQVFGYKPSELLGRNVSLVQPSAMREAHRHGMGDYVRTGTRKSHYSARESVGLRKDGKEIIIEISGSDMLLQGQRRFVGFIRDITSRKLAEQALRESQEQFRVAREIQQHLFPARSPEIPGFEIAGASFSAEATGGDYFDYLQMLEGRLGLVVGDVTGHGIGPALLMAEAHAYLRLLVHNRSDLGQIFGLANRTLVEDVGGERFITMLLACLDPARRSLTFLNAGHPSGYLLDAEGKVKVELKPTAMALGIHPDAPYQTGPEILLAAGDTLLLVTDGLEEALGPGDKFFGSEGVLDFVRAHLSLPAESMVRELHETARRFAQDSAQMDDVTIIVAKVK